MQRAVVGACFLAVCLLVAACWVAAQDIALWNETGKQRTVCAQQKDRVKGGEEGREDASNDRLPCYANVRTDSREEEVESCNEGSGKRGAGEIVLLEDAREDQGKRGHSDAGQLVDGKGCVAIRS